jgi:CheY-like chemotaxis protein
MVKGRLEASNHCSVSFNSSANKLSLLAFHKPRSFECSLIPATFIPALGEKGTVVPGPSILLADDNIPVLNYVRKILAKDFEVVGALHDGESVLRQWTRWRPSVIVLDISMGDPNGIEVARQLKSSGCNSQIIFLTIHKDPEFVRAALEAGGSGYVLKSTMGKDLRPAIDAVLSGKRFVSPGAAFEGCIN